MNFLSPRINSVGTLHRAFSAPAGEELVAVGAYEKGLSSFFALCMAILVMPIPFLTELPLLLFENYHKEHKEEKINDFLSIAKEIGATEIVHPDGMPQIQVGEFTLTETIAVRDEIQFAVIVIRDVAGNEKVLPDGLTLEQLKKNAADLVETHDMLKTFPNLPAKTQEEFVTLGLIYAEYKNQYAKEKKENQNRDLFETPELRNQHARSFIENNQEYKKILEHIFPMWDEKQQRRSLIKSGRYYQICWALTPKSSANSTKSEIQKYDDLSAAINLFYLAIKPIDDSNVI